MVETGGMSISRLSWQEIESWLNATNRELTGWELSTIKRLSEEYAAEYSQASEKSRPAPFTAEVIDRKQIANKITNILSSFGKQEPKYTIEE